jgi:type II secretory pathway component PulF
MRAGVPLVESCKTIEPATHSHSFDPFYSEHTDRLERGDELAAAFETESSATRSHLAADGWITT